MILCIREMGAYSRPIVLHTFPPRQDKVYGPFLGKDGGIYFVYLPNGGSTNIELPTGDFTTAWFNPRNGRMGTASPQAGKSISAPDKNDWLAVIRKNRQR